MLSPSDLAVFQRSALVYGMKDEYVQSVLSLGNEVLFRSGDEIIHHRGSDADIYVILDGRVNVLTDDGDKLTEAGPGKVLGEVAFLDAGPRHATAMAVGYVTALKFPAVALRRKMCDDKELGFWLLANLSRVLCSRLREADDRLDSLLDTAHEAWVTWDK